MSLHPATLALLAQEAEQRQLSLPELVSRLLPDSSEPGDPIDRMLHFAAGQQLTLGEDLRLRDLL